jgi:Zn-dependent protease
MGGLFAFGFFQSLLSGAQDVPVVVGAVLGVLGAAAMLASIVSHELGHALTARRYGVQVRDISLWLFGGVARLTSQLRRPGEELVVALAGPAVSIGLGVAGVGLGLGAAAAGAPEAVVALFTWVGVANLVLAVFNLLPGLPLDGGRAVQALLWLRHGDRSRATRTAAALGVGLGWVVIALGALQLANGGIGGLWTAMLGLMLSRSARMEGASVVVLERLGDASVADVMTRDPLVLPDYVSVEQFTGGYGQSQQTAFPLRSFAGDLVGVVSAAEAARVPAGLRSQVTVRQVAVPLDRCAWAAPDQPILDALAASPSGYLLVGSPAELVGVVSTADLHRVGAQPTGTNRGAADMGPRDAPVPVGAAPWSAPGTASPPVATAPVPVLAGVAQPGPLPTPAPPPSPIPAVPPASPASPLPQGAVPVRADRPLPPSPTSAPGRPPARRVLPPSPLSAGPPPPAR